MGNNLNNLIRETLELEILTTAINGSFQTRNRDFPVYNHQIGISDGNKKQIRNQIQLLLKNIRQDNYTNGQATSEQYIQDVESLAKQITLLDNDHNMLHKGRFRIGISQKLLGLYLKYSWVFGLIPEPPACPFDNYIIGILKLHIDWTKTDKREHICQLIKTAKPIAQGDNLSLAQWELKEWHKKRLQDYLVSNQI